MANLQQKMSGFPAHILPEIRRLVVLAPEQLFALHAALKRFTHGWLSELAKLATVTAADEVRHKWERICPPIYRDTDVNRLTPEMR
jgi:hypothetical protein